MDAYAGSRFTDAYAGSRFTDDFPGVGALGPTWGGALGAHLGPIWGPFYLGPVFIYLGLHPNSKVSPEY